MRLGWPNLTYPGDRLETSLGAKSLPEMTFGSELTLTHAGSGVQLAFTAADALREWKARDPLLAGAPCAQCRAV